MKQAILFDIDGTVLDAREFVFDAVKHALAKAGYPYPSEKDIKKHKPDYLIDNIEDLLNIV